MWLIFLILTIILIVIVIVLLMTKKAKEPLDKKLFENLVKALETITHQKEYIYNLNTNLEKDLDKLNLENDKLTNELVIQLGTNHQFLQTLNAEYSNYFNKLSNQVKTLFENLGIETACKKCSKEQLTEKLYRILDIMIQLNITLDEKIGNLSSSNQISMETCQKNKRQLLDQTYQQNLKSVQIQEKAKNVEQYLETFKNFFEEQIAPKL